MSVETLTRDGVASDRPVVVVGGGANTAHMAAALDRLNESSPVHVAEIREPFIRVVPDQLHLVNTPEGEDSLRRLIGSGVCRAAYLSLVPRQHLPSLEEYLGYAGKGLIDTVVIPKPAVRSIEEMRKVDVALRAARRDRRERGLGDDENPILYVHEHYVEKGAWSAFREQLGAVSQRLGRLETAVFDIQEARTAESEGRTEAFAGGALEDFGPHLSSLGLEALESINSAGDYVIENGPETTIDRFRYEDSELPEGVETGFIVRGLAKIKRNAPGGAAHDLKFIWQGGKGFIDSKRVTLTFVDPQTDKRSKITVDLRQNSIDAPQEVQDLFPVTQFEDNGYGAVVERGLNGDPQGSFQDWEQARTVTKWMHVLSRKGEAQAPRRYPRGVPLQDLVVLYT